MLDENVQQMMNLVIAGSIFGLVLSIWVFGILLWSARRMGKVRQMQQRLGITHPHTGGRTRTLQLWHEGTQYTTLVPTGSRAGGLLMRVHRACLAAGWTIGAGPFLLMLFGAAVFAAAIIAVVMKNTPLGVGVGVAILVVFRIYMLGKINKREAMFETQLVDAMDLAARSLRAGHPMLGAFQLIAEEMAPPVSTVFAEMCQRHEMGASLEESLRDTAEESTSSDLTLFATSVAIQMRTGGNLAELIDRLAAVVRERMRLSRRVRVMTAQTQMSKRVLLALPFVMLVLLSLLNPSYMDPLFSTTAGNYLLAFGAAGLALGAWVMSRMAVLRF